MKRLGNWIAGLGSSEAVGIRAAGEENSWFIHNGFEHELLSLEESLGPHLGDKISILCSYDLSNISELQLKRLIKSHSLAVTDEPFMVYRRRNV
ncbi:MAG: hypothetical protein QXX64_06515 [Nitrososphaera sp.]